MEFIFKDKKKKDLTIPVHYTIRESLVKKVNIRAEKSKISSSKVVDTILENYFNNHD